ncbi:MAG: hypothetical protein AAGC53_14010 [Actinomycetota bacterium]
MLPLLVFAAIPVVAGGLLTAATMDNSGVAGGLIAGVAVLGGLLFQVLAWIGGRIASIADQTDANAPSDYSLRLVRKLDIARANIAYASFVSISLVILLAVSVSLDDRPDWLRVVVFGVLFHLALTLLLVVFRINRIATDDRISAITARARIAAKQ